MINWLKIFLCMSEHMVEDSIFIRHRSAQLLYRELFITLFKQQSQQQMKAGARHLRDLAPCPVFISRYLQLQRENRLGHGSKRKSASDYMKLSNLCLGLLQCQVNLPELLGDMPAVDTISTRERKHTVTKLLQVIDSFTQARATSFGIQIRGGRCMMFEEFQINL